MKTEIVDHSATKKELKIEIEAKDVRAEYDRVANNYARQANVPGFRKGHAPVSVIRSRFKNEIRSDVLQNLVPDAVSRAIEESGLRVISQPDVHLANENLDKLGDAPISLHAHVEVLPEVELGEYAGIAASRSTRPVTDEVVEKTIEQLRESSASLQPVEDRGAEEGDTVTANFHGRFLESSGEEDINVEEVDVLIGGPGVHEAFNEHLKGVRPDDVKTFAVEYPEDFSSPGLAGKKIEYTATVTAVRRKELPELNDEWAQSLGEEEIDSIETLRKRVRENLEAHARNESEGRLRDQVMDSLIEAHKFEVPETLVEHHANRVLQSAVRDMMQHGIDPRAGEFDWEGMRERARSRAEDEMRGSMLLERIAEEEKIEVSDEEIDAEIKALAEATKQTPDQVRAALTKQGGASSIADRLRSRKALDLLVEKANVTEEEWREIGEEESEESESAEQATDESAEAKREE